MRIRYAPFIDKQVDFRDVTVELDGTFSINGTINGRPATLEMSAKEARAIYRDLKKLDVEALARIHAAS